MREVNNTNSNNVNFQGVQTRGKDLVQSEILPQIEAQEITDLGRMPAEVIGRSQVVKTPSNKDVDFVLNNPDKVEDLNRYFDYLIDVKGLTYEDACSVIGATSEEFFGA